MDASGKKRNPIISSASLELSSAAELIANNVDLLAQILLCFPVISLLRFKCVSKQWLSLISDSQFAAKHSCRNPRPSASGFFLRVRDNFKSVSLQGHPNPPLLEFLHGIEVADFPPMIAHSCNGLLLFKYRCIALSSDHYFVCNPTTKTYTLLPDPTQSSSWYWPGTPGDFLAFDPSKSPCYKVVLMGDHNSNVEKFYIYIYFSETASWKQFRLPNRIFYFVLFCGGVIYWLTDQNALLGFDVDSEKMIKMPNPLKLCCADKVIKYFGECDGRLILIQTETYTTIEFKILEMDRDYSRWIVKFQVNLGPLFLMECRFYGYSVLCVVKGDKERDFELVLGFAGKLVSYNLMSQTWNVLDDVGSADESLSPL